MKLETDIIEQEKQKTFTELRDNEDLSGDENGRVDVLDHRFNIMGADYFMAEILEMLAEVYGEGAGGILNNTGRGYAEDLVDLLQVSQDSQQAFGQYLGMLKFLGYSDIHVEEDGIIVPSSPTAESHLEQDHEEKKTCYFLTGMFAGGLEYLFDEEVLVQEESCKAAGDSECVFRIKVKQDE
ncbi:MAG: V4R domain-containing protein [Candidatus Nanohaloarchaea archaeon]